MPQRPGLNAYHPSLGERIQQGFASGLTRLGVDPRYANHLGARTFNFLNDVSPLGNITMAADAGTAFRQGQYGQGLGLGALAVLPGGVGKKAKGMFGGGVKRVLYRGTTDSPERIKGGIAEGFLFAAPEERYARLYGDSIEQIGVLPTAKILRDGTPEFKKVTGRKGRELFRSLGPGENMASAGTDAVQKAKAAGYDAVEFASGEDGIAIINPQAFIRNFKAK